MATYYPDGTTSVLRVVDGILGPPAAHEEKWIGRKKTTLSIDHHKDSSGRRVQFSPDGKHLVSLREAIIVKPIITFTPELARLGNLASE
jgi:hypothetical protein